MKRIFLALVLTCVGAAGSVTLSGQAACRAEADCNAGCEGGSAVLRCGQRRADAARRVLRARRARGRHRRGPSHRRQRQRRHLRHSAARPTPESEAPSSPAASSVFATPTATARPTSSARSSATVGGTGLELRNGYLYYAAVDAHRPVQADARRAEACGSGGDRRRRISCRRRPRGEGHRVRQRRQRVRQHRAAVECLPDSRSSPGRSRHRSVPAARRSRRHLALQGRRRRTEVHEGSAVCHRHAPAGGASRGTTDISMSR